MAQLMGNYPDVLVLLYTHSLTRRQHCTSNHTMKLNMSGGPGGIVLLSLGDDRGPRASPKGLNPMHILLYPRDCSYRKIILTGKNLGYRVFTSRLFKETHIRHTEKNLGIGVTDFLITL